MSGWPEGLSPNIAYPFVRGGDAAFTDWSVQRLIEGWIFNNPRSGYPFGSNFLDYPSSDAGGFLLLKILGITMGTYYAAINLFFLLSFPAITLAAFICLRSIKLNAWLSLSASIVYAFAPFHFLRIGHLFYAWYFVVPIFFYFAFRIFFLKKDYSLPLKNLKFWLLLLCIAAILSSFGVYYALFGIIVILIGGLAGTASQGSLKNFFMAFGLAIGITVGVIANISPNVANNQIEGRNTEAVSRSLSDSEVYGFKLMQLLLPHPGHRIEKFSKKTSQYNNSTPLVNENITSSLGLIGVLGLIILGATLIFALSGKKTDARLSLFSLIGLALFLFGTIGGLGSLFAMLISSSIRGWNRISIFIDFAAIASTFLVAQFLVLKFISTAKLQKWSFAAIAIALALLGILDQTNWACKPCNQENLSSFKLESGFIEQLESKLPKGSAIYQLPYMAFPEVPPMFGLHTYEHATGFTNSKALLWNYGGMKGRTGDQFFRALAKEPIYKQIEVVQKLGFAAIYIDRRGFSDNGAKILAELNQIIGTPLIARADDQIVVYKLKPTESTSIANLSNDEIVTKSGFSANSIQTRYKATLQEGIDFKKDGFPEFLKSASGIDGLEDWGRWSNASISPTIKLEFKKPLPVKFRIELKAVAFGPNLSAPIKIQVGNEFKTLKIGADQKQIYGLEFNNINAASVIEFTPPTPTSPNELNPQTSDIRKLGIGFISLKVIPTL